MNLVKPTKFTVKISGCGVNTFKSNYKKFEDDSALLLLFDSVQVISKDFVGQENNLSLQYDLAKLLLMTMDGYDKNKLLEELEHTKEKEMTLINKWKMKVE